MGKTRIRVKEEKALAMEFQVIKEGNMTRNEEGWLGSEEGQLGMAEARKKKGGWMRG